MIREKSGAAALSIASNLVLVGLKLAAGAITGSIAILTEAIHSSIDLLASIVAFASVRVADEPADESHPYGHEKMENLAAAIEGMLILVGAGIIVFEAVRRLAGTAEVHQLGVGIAVVGFGTVVNLCVSTFLYRQAHRHDSAALEGDAAHLRADALTSIGVLAGLVAIQITGQVKLDAIVALVVAAAIVAAGIRILNRSSRILVDETLPSAELRAVQEAIADASVPEVAGYHKLRARRAGSRRHIDLHVQFRSGTTLEHAHALAHRLQGAIMDRIAGADVLIHVEPERVKDQKEAGADRQQVFRGPR